MLRISPRTKLTASTVTDIDRLRTMVRKIPDLGYAVSEDEFAQGGTGTAAPILSSDGQLVAVLNVGCVSSRYRDRKDAVIGALKASAASLSERLVSSTV